MSSTSSEASAAGLPWKHRLLLRVATLICDASLRSDSTIHRWPFSILDRKRPASSKPEDGVSSSDLIIDTSRDLWVRIYTPTDRGDDALTLPVIVFYHGGGFAFGSAGSVSSDMAARRFARELGALIISVNYRLAPEYRFPCQYEDGFDALKYIDDMEEGVLPAEADLSRCFILGESAGGNLGHHVAVMAGVSAFKKVKLVGLIALQPFFGGEERTEAEIRLCKQPPLTLRISDWFWEAFLPAGSDRDHPAANVVGPNGVELSGTKFPATLIIVGGLDPLQVWQRRYLEGLKRWGKEAEVVEFPEAVHGFFGFRDLPEYSSMIKEIKDFMARQISK